MCQASFRTHSVKERSPADSPAHRDHNASANHRKLRQRTKTPQVSLLRSTTARAWHVPFPDYVIHNSRCRRELVRKTGYIEIHHSTLCLHGHVHSYSTTAQLQGLAAELKESGANWEGRSKANTPDQLPHWLAADRCGPMSQREEHNSGH